MKILFMFPGQGSQTVDMLHHLPTNEFTCTLLDQTQEVLQQDILLLDSSDSLKKTKAVQICLLIAGVAYTHELISLGIKPDVVTGMSIGAFPAAVIAGVLSFNDAVKLVALRGELMQKAYPQGYGLTAIIGLFAPQVATLVKQINSEHSPVYLANINSATQIIIAGSETAMQKVAALAQQHGASKVTRLAVSAPSHCELLTLSAEKLAVAFKSITLSSPQINYVSGNTGRVIVQPEQVANDLIYNMARPMHWYETTNALYEHGVRIAIEIPPGNVLTHLLQRSSDIYAVAQQDIAATEIKKLVVKRGAVVN